MFVAMTTDEDDDMTLDSVLVAVGVGTDVVMMDGVLVAIGVGTDVVMIAIIIRKGT